MALVPRASSLPPVHRSGLFNKHEPRRTGYVYDVMMMLHNDGMDEDHRDRHPERPKRISKVFELLVARGVIPRMRRINIREATREEIELIHPISLLTKMDQMEAMLLGADTEAAIADSKGYYESLSLYVHPSTAQCARLACGGVIEAAMAVAKREVRNSFAIVRPPGHHAEPEEHMGFCFYNNVAVAVRVVQNTMGIRKVLILDWDVHHGNGTQKAFYQDPDVLYISLHRYEGGDFYPGGTFGGMDKCGELAGIGRNVNIPWPVEGMGDGDYIHAFQKLVMPIAYEFAPELVIVSAGFDAAEGDLLGGCHVSPACYAHMTHMLSVLAEGKMVVALEGGYNLEALSQSALAVGETLIGEQPPELPPVVVSQPGTETVWQVARYQSKYWKSINPQACEPQAEQDPNIFSIAEILKQHRLRDLSERYNLLSIPLSDTDLEARFADQVLCTPKLYEDNSKPLVFFMHDFGNLRVELESALRCDVQMERSYLIDASRQLVDWANTRGYNLIDLNIFTNHIVEESHLTSPQQEPAGQKKLLRKLVHYIWDNYIDLAEAQNIILIGHGSACQSVIDLLHERAIYLGSRVKAVVQINGMNTIPLVPRHDDDLRLWYHKNSLVVLPAKHTLCQDNSKVLRRHGSVVTCPEDKAAKVLEWAVEHLLKTFIDKQFNAVPPAVLPVEVISQAVTGPAPTSNGLSIDADEDIEMSND